MAEGQAQKTKTTRATGLQVRELLSFGRVLYLTQYYAAFDWEMMCLDNVSLLVT